MPNNAFADRPPPNSRPIRIPRLLAQFILASDPEESTPGQRDLQIALGALVSHQDGSVRLRPPEGGAAQQRQAAALRMWTTQFRGTARHTTDPVRQRSIVRAADTTTRQLTERHL